MWVRIPQWVGRGWGERGRLGWFCPLWLRIYFHPELNNCWPCFDPSRDKPEPQWPMGWSEAVVGRSEQLTPKLDLLGNRGHSLDSCESNSEAPYSPASFILLAEIGAWLTLVKAQGALITLYSRLLYFSGVEITTSQVVCPSRWSRSGKARAVTRAPSLPDYHRNCTVPSPHVPFSITAFPYLLVLPLSQFLLSWPMHLFFFLLQFQKQKLPVSKQHTWPRLVPWTFS